MQQTCMGYFSLDLENGKGRETRGEGKVQFMQFLLQGALSTADGERETETPSGVFGHIQMRQFLRALKEIEAVG